MAKKTKKAPQELAEEKLDGVAGGLLPAVQAAREAAGKSYTSPPRFLGGVTVAAGDVD